MAQYTYITLNDGTKWRIKGDVQPQTNSGPYRYVYTEDSSAKTGTSGSAKSGTSKSGGSGGAKSGSAVNTGPTAAQLKEEARKEKIKSIKNSKSAEIKYLGGSYDAQRQAAKAATEDNMRQLFIAYMQGLRGIPQQSALWGAGGEIESLKNRSRLNYEDNRAKEKRSYAGVLAQIEQKYNDDLRDLEDKYLKLLMNV